MPLLLRGDGSTVTALKRGDGTDVRLILDHLGRIVYQLVDPAFDFESINPLYVYSLHRAILTYTGFAIRVRRSSDNLEQDIGFDIVGNLDIAGLLAFVGVGNGFVVTEYDQQGNRDVTESDINFQPLIVSSGVLEVYDNGRPKISHDGIDDFLFQALDYGAVGSVSVFSVQQFDASAPSFSTIWGALEDADRRFHLSQRQTNGTLGPVYDGAAISPSGGDITTHSQTSYIATDSGRLQLYQDGLIITDVARNANHTIAAPFAIGAISGGTLLFQGGQSEVVVVPSDQTLNHVAVTNIQSDYWLQPTLFEHIMFHGFSLKRVVSYYTGACIRVRRSSDDSVLDIGISSNGDLDIASLLAFVGAGNGFVVTWYNQTGNDDLNAVAPINQPLIVSSGVLNLTSTGKVGMLFDGADTGLVGVSSFGAIADVAAFSVQEMNLGGDNFGRVYGTQQDPNNRFVMQQKGVLVEMNALAGGSGLELSGGDLTTFSQVSFVKIDGGSSSIYQDGVLLNSATSLVANASTDAFSIGSSTTPILNNFDGNVCEVLLYKELPNRLSVEASQNVRWETP